jgi:hypothetical protein
MFPLDGCIFPFNGHDHLRRSHNLHEDGEMIGSNTQDPTSHHIDQADQTGGQEGVSADELTLNPIEVVHEVSNLLTIVMSCLQRLGRQSLDEEGRQYIEYAEESAYKAGLLLHKHITKTKIKGEAPSLGRSQPPED